MKGFCSLVRKDLLEIFLTKKVTRITMIFIVMGWLGFYVPLFQSILANKTMTLSLNDFVKAYRIYLEMMNYLLIPTIAVVFSGMVVNEIKPGFTAFFASRKTAVLPILFSKLVAGCVLFTVSYMISVVIVLITAFAVSHGILIGKLVTSFIFYIFYGFFVISIILFSACFMQYYKRALLMSLGIIFVMYTVSKNVVFLSKLPFSLSWMAPDYVAGTYSTGYMFLLSMLLMLFTAALLFLSVRIQCIRQNKA